MPRTVFAVIALVSCAAYQASPSEAQTPDFSDTWILDEDASRVTPEAGFEALGAVGTPERLHIAHAANGDLAVPSEWNTSEARVYRPGSKTVIPVGPDDRLGISTSGDGDATSTMVCTRLRDLGPCEPWSEPCQPR